MLLDNMKLKNEIPKSPEAWLKEIASAYLEAFEKLRFDKLTGSILRRKTFFI